jgi:hypothetical protein
MLFLFFDCRRNPLSVWRTNPTVRSGINKFACEGTFFTHCYSKEAFYSTGGCYDKTKT